MEINDTSPKSSRSPRSPGTPCGKQSPGRRSPVKHHNTGRDGHPKKDGSGGKGTWGPPLLDKEDDHQFDPSDPNYESSQGKNQSSPSKPSADFDEFKKKATVIVEEYFTTDDILSAANELRDLGRPSYHYYFVEKLVSLAMDRHNKEKEMASVLLSILYADVIDPPQVYKGFFKLVEASDDLLVDIPDTVDVLALFIARAVVDEMLPPAFLKERNDLLDDSKGIQVLKRAEKSYLSAPPHAEIILRRWGGSKNTIVEDVKTNINNLLVEYIGSGDKKEACSCIKDLKVPFFHHDIVKRALILAMERKLAEGLILDLLKKAYEEGLINSSQISKGFNRLIEMIDDLSLDIPSARNLLQSLISKAASEGWLSASSLNPIQVKPEKQVVYKTVRLFKMRATTVIQEYFLLGDIPEVISSLEAENNLSSTSLNAIFIKKLITLAMDRKN